MRKVGLAVISVAVLALSGSAAAQAASYTVGGSVSGGGSKAKPVPASLKLNVAYQGTDRPPTSRLFSLAVQGLRVATTGFKTCTVASLNAAQTDSGCNKAAKVGSGYVKNLVGNTPDQTSITIRCNLAVTLYNAGGGRLAVWLKGASGLVVAGGDCPIGINQALDGKLRNTRTGMALSFTIPNNLMHPLDGLNQGISEISVAINKKTTTVTRRGRSTKVALLASTGCRGSRNITLALGLETGTVDTSRGSAKC